MAQEFVRNIKHTDATKEPLYTTQQNDLISDDKDVYVHNNGKYEKITGNDFSSDIKILQTDNTKNKDDIATNKTAIGKNADGIKTNKTAIAKNSVDINTLLYNQVESSPAYLSYENENRIRCYFNHSKTMGEPIDDLKIGTLNDKYYDGEIKKTNTDPEHSRYFYDITSIEDIKKFIQDNINLTSGFKITYSTDDGHSFNRILLLR